MKRFDEKFFTAEFLSHIKPDEIWIVKNDDRIRKVHTVTKCLVCDKEVTIISKYHARYEYHHSDAIKLREQFCPHCRVGASHMEIYQHWLSLVNDDCWKDDYGNKRTNY